MVGYVSLTVSGNCVSDLVDGRQHNSDTGYVSAGAPDPDTLPCCCTLNDAFPDQELVASGVQSGNRLGGARPTVAQLVPVARLRSVRRSIEDICVDDSEPYRAGDVEPWMYRQYEPIAGPGQKYV